MFRHPGYRACFKFQVVWNLLSQNVFIDTVHLSPYHTTLCFDIQDTERVSNFKLSGIFYRKMFLLTPGILVLSHNFMFRHPGYRACFKFQVVWNLLSQNVFTDTGHLSPFRTTLCFDIQDTERVSNFKLFGIFYRRMFLLTPGILVLFAQLYVSTSRIQGVFQISSCLESS